MLRGYQPNQKIHANRQKIWRENPECTPDVKAAEGDAARSQFFAK
jgi:hypothetical protein